MSNIYYVYYYLREKDSAIAKAGTPYYVGKGCNGRIFGKHNVPVPSNPDCIVKICEDLSEEAAYLIERLHIALFGRVDMQTGILRNLTDGGAGVRNISPETRLKCGHSRGKYWWHNNKKDKISKNCPGQDYTRGRLLTSKVLASLRRMQQKSVISVRGSRWWTDGKISVRSNECPGKNYRAGMHFAPWNKDRKIGYHWTNGTTFVVSATCPGDGWYRQSPLKGKPALWRRGKESQSNHKNTLWWHNGTRRKRCANCPGAGWQPGFGMITRGSKGMLLWNNGEIQKLSKECPGQGWVRGQLPVSMS